jgi:RNA polymerase sigma-70 factor (ECF subfamily)
MADELDKETLARAARGDGPAFRQVVEAYQSLVYNLAYRHVYNRTTAEDLAQECFARLYQNFGQYDLQRPFRPWLMRLAANVCLNWLRQERRYRPLPSPAGGETDTGVGAGDVPDESPGPATLAEDREVRQVVREAVAALPPEYRTVIALRYFEGLDHVQIAQTLEIPVGTAKIRLFRAREMLKRRLAGTTHAAIP